MNTYLSDVLYSVAQDLLIPTMGLVIVLIALSLFSVGSILVERLTERRHLKAKIPELVDTLDAATVFEFDSIIENSGLLNRQREALHEIVKHRQLPEDSLVALAKRIIASEDLHYQKIVSRSDLAAKISPMLGLMGTLIPLGPGIVAMGSNDLATLSNSLLVAFDTTIAGLVIALIMSCISKVRKHWYEDYMVSTESIMTCMLEKMLAEKQEGEV